MSLGYDDEFPKRLKNTRLHRGLTQSQLAEKTLISRRRIAGYEAGETHPDFSNLKAIASKLNVDASWLSGAGSLPVSESPSMDMHEALGMPIHLDPKTRKRLYKSAQAKGISLHDEIIRRLRGSLDNENPTASETLVSIAEMLKKRGL